MWIFAAGQCSHRNQAQADERYVQNLGGYNVYRLEHLSTGKVTTFNVRDIVPFISNEAYERVLEEQQEEEKEDSDAALADEDFDPQPGDFLLFPNFQDVPYHLIRVKTRPFDDHITFNYYGVKKTNKTRLKGWQLVWTHPSKSARSAI